MLDDHGAAVEMLGRDRIRARSPTQRLRPRPSTWSSRPRLTDVTWPSARIVRSIEEIRTFKHDGHGTAYVVGGPTLIASLLDADLLDELRLIVNPILIGAGQGITGVLSSPQRLELVATEPAAGGRATLTYRRPRAR